ncbi:MAG: aminotransferase class I/II-fold pyridoxal phosphate-dependent enzyme [Lachnospiraceae bacterium]|nr:aminotransferase class I/II-fold pyridoxal phosphate-dependent enzyme [Lachnospiraceae bacterium]
MAYSIETRCIHGEEHNCPDPNHAISYPIYQTASFSHLTPGHNPNGFDYSRESNPTRAHLEETVASLENAADAVAFSSGMAAISTCMDLFSPGDRIICTLDLYGGSVRLFQNIGTKNGLVFSYIDTSDLSLVEQELKAGAAAIYLETPSNPMMLVTDIRGCAELAKKYHALLIVDNTFLSPYFQNPLDLGADIVIHSGTKYLSGHNDTVCGFLCSSTEELAAKFRLLSKTTGAVLAPFDSWLVLRGLKTLAVRMDRTEENALKIAEALQKCPYVEQVRYVGLPDHPGYEVNRKQSRGAGGMISFTVDTVERAERILKNVKLITFAESLGGAETLITYPIVQTHKDVPEETKKILGLSDRLLRLSVGLEKAEDILADLFAAAEG